MHDHIIIRRLESIPDMVAVNELEKLVWGSQNPVCVEELLVVCRNGGFLLGAFHGEQMVGMLFSIPCFLHGQVYLWSDMMGLRPEWRSQGIGEGLKRAQAETARQGGYPLIAWTYDPLETVNGYLNMGKLGAHCSTYHVDYYGAMENQLNRGLPTDRFQVEWWLDRPRSFLLPPGAGKSLISWQLNGAGFPRPHRVEDPLPDGDKLVVSVPARFQDMKQKDFELAKTWKEVTRQVFTKCFDAGWAVGGFNLRKTDPVHEYILVKRSTLTVPKAPWMAGEG
ncbi:GNAT family N-acetyltransferase [Candidatus Formimonas warabiya]|uniref:N-acetyltransferase domain-containing protein n=1 Tax=Formimonas warabiya TaxID=1761012 RepID=A0A3G1KTD6_FORW1|nr:GNAT family N-acetyltransferase [Candidatus Formimonas warabiya]ATW25731.1 hypothetical protein DCMF_14030 [Candidatus Formimonas warabiya]